MPRVSDEHLAARREQILQAAAETFAANGFHATTMADVIRASSLSAGAVYRYFRGKDELVAAIAERAIGVGTAALQGLLAHQVAPSPIEVLRHLITALENSALSGPVDLRRLALQAWAEALRDEQIMKTARRAQLSLRAYFEEAVRRSRDHGQLADGADPALVAQAMQSLLIGYVLQALLVGDVDAESYLAGVSTLLAPPPGAG